MITNRRGVVGRPVHSFHSPGAGVFARRLLARFTGTAAVLAAALMLAFLAAPGTAFAQDVVTFTWEVDGNEVTEITVPEGVGTVNLRLKATLTTDDPNSGEGTGTVSGVKVEFNPNGWGGSSSGRATRLTDWSFTGTQPDDGGEHTFLRNGFTGVDHSATLNLQLTITDDTEMEGDETIIATYTNPGEINTNRDNITLKDGEGNTLTSESTVRITITIKDNDTAPAKLTGLTAAPGPRSVLLTWDDPNNPTIKAYQVSTDGGAWADVSTELTTDTPPKMSAAFRPGHRYPIQLPGARGERGR